MSRRSPAQRVVPAEREPGAAATTSHERPVGRAVLATLLLVFAASGFSALVYQVVWMRLLTALLGSTSAAIAAVLSAFMGGMALGSLAFGRLVDRRVHALKVFAMLEAGIAASGLAFPSALPIVTPLYAWLEAGSVDRSPVMAASQFVVCLLLLLVPTSLMGGTLPALARAVVPPARVARGVATLYGANTFGATAGAFSAGFVLLPWLGLRTTYVAVLLNATTAAIGWALARRLVATPTGGTREPAAPASTHSGVSPGLGRLVLLSAAVSGFAALASEVAWTRMLVFGLGSTTYAFAAMLTTFLAGLSLGSVAASRAARWIRRPVRALAIAQGLVGLATVGSLIAYARYAIRLDEATRAAAEVSWLSASALSFLTSAVALLPATALMGATFPLACAAYAGGRATLGAPVGRLAGVNTMGAIAGSLAAAFALIPTWGIQSTLLFLGAVNIAVALVLVGATHPARSARWLAAAGSLVALAAVPMLAARAPLHQVEPDERLLFYREGPLSTVSVVQGADGFKTLCIDKIGVAGTDPVLMTDQKSLAHVPMLLHPGATRALTVGFGSGGASWSFTRYARLRAVDAVEIDPTVLEATPYFRESHHDVFRDPRFRLVLDDARSFLRRTDRTYDVISTDCTDLRYKSNAMLYTREYFELCRRRLAPGGLTVVWLPLGGLSTEDLRVALATFLRVFPRASVWYMNNVPAHYVLLVGAEREIPLDVEMVERQLAERTVAEDLAEIGLADAWKLLSSFLMDGGHAAQFAAGAAFNTDDRPLLEFTVPHGGFKGSITRNLLSLLAARQPPRLEASSGADAALARQYWQAAGALVRGHAVFQRGNYDYRAAIAQYEAARAINPRDAQIPRLIAQVQATEASRMSTLERRVSRRPDDATSRNDLGLAHLARRDHAAAAAEFDAAARLEPDNWEIRFNRGLAYERAGALGRAESAYRAAIARAPLAASPHTNLGLLLLQRRSPEAIGELHRALELEPGNADSAYNLGVAYQRLQRVAEARAAYERALAIDPSHAAAMTDLGVLLLEEGKVAQALATFDRALDADGTYAEAHYNRGLALDVMDRAREAEGAYREALRFRPEYVEALNNLGVLYDRAGARPLAIDYFRRALSTRASYAEAHSNLALALAASGLHDEARDHAERAVALAPESAQAHAALGAVRWQAGDRAGTVASLERALAIDPALAEARQLLGKVRPGR